MYVCIYMYIHNNHANDNSNDNDDNDTAKISTIQGLPLPGLAAARAELGGGHGF